MSETFFYLVVNSRFMALFGNEHYLGDASSWWEEIATVGFGIILGVFFTTLQK